MATQILQKYVVGCVLGFLMMSAQGESFEVRSSSETLTLIQQNRDNEEVLKTLLSTVRCGFKPSKYEQILLTQLRDKTTTTKKFRKVSRKMGELLVAKVVECLPTTRVEVETPVAMCEGERLEGLIDLVSVMRSGDALLDVFIEHFPKANISKILIQRDEATAQPLFKYMKMSSTIAQNHPVIITEPMVATGGTLNMVIQLLKKSGVQEKNIIIACMFAAPEGLVQLTEQFPQIQIVMTVLDEKLNEKKYIVPGLGDFGDRFFGTCEYHE